MLRTACLLLGLLASLPAAAQNFAGTFTAKNPAGNTVTLSLKQDAQGKVSGTLAGNNANFKVNGQVQQGTLLGTVAGDGGSLYILAELQGNEIHVSLAEVGPGGAPNMQRVQQIVLTRSAAGSKAPAAAAPAKPAPTGEITDEQARAFLTGNAWCGFTYNQRTGTSTKERVVFGTDGWVARSSGAETYSSGYGGTVAGQSANAERARWRVRNLQLELSQDGVNWAPQPLEVTRNSNGSPIIKSGGKEYMVCR